MTQYYQHDVAKPDAMSPGHALRPSRSSDATGFADSTISYGESIQQQLSHFPLPPPTLSAPLEAHVHSFVPNSPNTSYNVPRAAPSYLIRKLPAVPAAVSPAILSQPSPSTIRSSASSSKVLSPKTASSVVASAYDWHEGASSIDVDATEDQLLPTSFITSLLQENKGPRIGQRASFSSDAVSGISEMTYPRVNLPTTSRKPVRLPGPEQRPHGARPVPSSYHHKPSGPSQDDAASYISDARTFVIQEANYSEKFVIGVAPVVPHKTSLSGQILTETRAIGIDSTAYKRRSTSSIKTSSLSILSKISSRKSIRRMFTRTKVKPLPPVPLIPDIPIAMEREHREAEDATPLPELMQRAGTLQDLLERGYHPHHSLISYREELKIKDTLAYTEQSSTQSSPRQFVSFRYQSYATVDRAKEWLSRRVPSRPMSRSERAKYWLVNLSPLLFLLVIVIAAAVGVTISKNTHHHTGSACQGNFTGADCDLDATCICTSTGTGQCNELAQSIVDLVPYLNDQFMVNFTNGDIYIGLWQAQGPPSGSNCAEQALLIDVAPALSSVGTPNRTQWARTAILWNLVESQDLEASQALRSFVVQAPWDEAASNNSTLQASFSTTVSGYTFDFASQSVIAPAQSFSAIAQPSTEQNSRVNPTSRTALDYMYGYAVASSTQHNKSLMNYWQSTLLRPSNELQTFRTALNVSPILLPFDAASASVSSLLSTTNTSGSFPPPLACYPALNATSLDKLNAVEHDIFNMSTVTSQSQFSTECFPNHPVYGVLDVLQLRLPFPDSETGQPRQAVSLQQAASSRAILYKGGLLSSLVVSAEGVPITPQQQNPRRFGTLDNFDHVIYDYLLAMPNSTVANALVDFVLGNASTPPAGNSILFASLDSIPVLEVALFGSIQSSDIQSVPSSFTVDAGTLFFGSNAGSTLQQWCIAGINSTLVWAQSATSPLVVRSGNLTDKVFEEIWSAASRVQDSPGAINNLTASLTAYGYFKP